ncbi:GerAB/ArcD/ProY family transporter [Sulfobacillus harzensis]|uniref:GerAB/ArcD/ProY family transporter n=1 Tax=Sulfobacillus harzensis TaxID=2729629 RepID=A0A7Y0Q3T8_9FIRM|nr:GerAB/ArcD/ProY family transporter [Sulfobacillus harzensis]NMP23720.1 GerAB/ArcD/ProY family transporter [Sulfobacillus harzensis]
MANSRSPTTPHISPLEFGVLVLGSFIGLGIFQFPRELVMDAGPDALYGYLLECAGAYLALWLLLMVARLHQGASEPQVLRRYLGIFAWPIEMIAVLGHVALAIAVIANFGFVLRTFFLMSMPFWVAETPLLGTALFAVWYGMAPMARLMELVILPTMGLSILIGIMLFPQGQYAFSMIPSTEIMIPRILSGAYHQAYIFVGIEAAPLMYPYLRPQNRKEGERAAHLLFLGAFVAFLWGFFLIISATGPDFLITLQWPGISALRLVSISGLIVNKIGLLVVVLWGLFVLAFIAIRLWAVVHYSMAAIQRTGMTTYRIVACAAMLLIGLLAQRITNIAQLTHIFQSYLLPFYIGYLFLIPLIMLAGYAVTHRKRRTASVNT